MKNRVWELDALRGICILGVIIVHFVYDITELYALVQLDLPDIFLFVQRWGGVIFLLISGICATLGSRSVRRGAIVFACGMVITGVTYGMYRLNMATIGIIIYFGVLHCLGTCMLLWPLFRKLHWGFLLAIGAGFVALGFWMMEQGGVPYPWLMPLGLPWEGFLSSDYFPLFPYLGFFLLGSVLGKTLYRSKQTLLPKVRAERGILHFFCLCGKHSLWIYLLHQPILNGICWLMMSGK